MEIYVNFDKESSSRDSILGYLKENSFYIYIYMDKTIIFKINFKSCHGINL